VRRKGNAAFASWRDWRRETRSFSIFNRFYYEDVLVTRVHPELLVKTHESPAGGPDEKFWKDRYVDINTFEHHLHRNKTRIVKVFLHLSKEEQKKRFLSRLEDPAKSWKFSMADLAERQHWDEYQVAYEEALSATSTPWAPWYVVPADHKYALRALVGGIVVDAIDQMGLKSPELAADSLTALAKAKDELFHNTSRSPSDIRQRRLRRALASIFPGTIHIFLFKGVKGST
jgi:hypothetical protein